MILIRFIAEPYCHPVQLRGPVCEAGWRVRLWFHARCCQLHRDAAYLHRPGQRHQADLGVLQAGKGYISSASHEFYSFLST
jgi:hypothetical protein